MQKQIQVHILCQTSIYIYSSATSKFLSASVSVLSPENIFKAQIFFSIFFHFVFTTENIYSWKNKLAIFENQFEELDGVFFFLFLLSFALFRLLGTVRYSFSRTDSEVYIYIYAHTHTHTHTHTPIIHI